MIRVAIFNDTRTGKKHFGSDLVMRNLEAFLTRHNMCPVWYWQAGQDWRDKKHLLPHKNEIDAIIVNGEGTIHHSISSDKPHILAEIGVLAKEHYHVPAYLINSTFYANDNLIYEKLKLFNKIFARDKQSIGELSNHSIKGKYVPDLTLATRGNFTKKEKSYGIGVTDSVLPEITKDLVSLSIKYGFEYSPMILSNNKSIKNKFFHLKNRILNINLKKIEHNNFEDFIQWIQSKELIITGRYHTVTLCLLTKTPFIAVESNTPKISALLSDSLESSNRVINEKVSEPVINRFRNFDPFEISQLDKFLEKAIVNADAMFSEIHNDIITRQAFK